MKTIEELLLDINNDDINMSYKSVELSFRQMLTHIKSLIDNEMPEDIQLLLKTFTGMALEFFTQYERSLLMEIKKQHSIQKQVQELTNQIKDNASLEEVRVLLVKEEEAACVEYTRLVNTFPTLLQFAVDKLKDEWQRLNMLALANRTLIQNTNLFKALGVVVEVAASSVGIAAEKIAIVPGSSFALYFFSYLKNFAVLAVPIYSVKAPWAWSIFWHELAGYKVRKLKIAETIESLRKDLLGFQVFYGLKIQQTKDDLLQDITRNNQFSFGYLKMLLDDKGELNLDNLSSFEHQFEQALANLPQEDQLKTYDLIKAQGWGVDWFEELFEDAWSVLAIGNDFLPFFEDVLKRHSSVDSRHPPKEVRLGVAKELLNLMKVDFRDVKKPKSIIESVAQQILKFISLLQAASYHYEASDMKQISTRIIRTNLPESIAHQIGQSIQDWSTQVLQEGGSVREAKMEAENLINALSEDERIQLVSNLQSNSGSETIQVEPSYQELLGNKNYQELLDLSFYDADFGVASVKNVFYRTTSVYGDANLSSVPADVNGGFVKYDTTVGTKHTTIDSWNVAAAPGFKIQP